MFLAVFYEKRPCNPDKKRTGHRDRGDEVGTNYCWELANYEFEIAKVRNNMNNRTNILGENGEYVILTCISTVVLIVLFSLVLGTYCWAEDEACQCNMSTFLFVICFVFYVLYSVYLIFRVAKYTSLRDDYSMKKKHLKAFIKYARKTKYYKKAEIESRFGKVILDSLDLSWRQK